MRCKECGKHARLKNTKNIIDEIVKIYQCRNGHLQTVNLPYHYPKINKNKDSIWFKWGLL